MMTTAFDFGTHLANLESTSPAPAPEISIFVQYDEDLKTLRWSTNSNNSNNKVPFGRFFLLENQKIKTDFESVKMAATISGTKFDSNRLEFTTFEDDDEPKESSSIGPFGVINYRHVRQNDFLLRIESIHINLKEAKERGSEIMKYHHTAIINVAHGFHKGSPIGAMPINNNNFNGNWGVLEKEIEEEIEEEEEEEEEEEKEIEEEEKEIEEEEEEEEEEEIEEEEIEERSRALTPPPEIY